MKTNKLAALLARSAGLWLGCAARLLPLLLLLTLPAVVQAQFNYTTNNGAITITGYTGPGGAVTIPSTINGLPVTRIGDYAFQVKGSLTSVTIPNSVTIIGSWAFLGCDSLTNVTIGNSVTSIGYAAFNSCNNLTSVAIGNSVTSIGDYAFVDCTSLTSLTIPNSVTNIGNFAFGHNPSLTNVTLGNSVTSIGSYAFYQTRLTRVTIPNSVTSIGFAAFVDCTSLSAITVEALNSSYSSVDGVLFDKSQTTLIQYPGGKAGSYTIPNSVTNIGDEAFIFCFGLTNVTIGNSVTNIGAGAFWYCTSLTSVTIPNSVTNIGATAFFHCTSLTSVTIPNSVTSIGGGAFEGCTSLTSVTIGNSVTSIANYAFGGCSSLTAITVDALNSAYSSVDGVLFNKNQTTLIQYPGGKAGSYTIPNTVTSIGGYAFAGCTSLTSVTIPNSVTSIESFCFDGGCSGAFSGCTSLTNVTIGDGVTNIEDWAFSYCTNLTGVYFSGNAPSVVEFYVFDGSNKATVYYLPGTTGWGATFAGRPTAQWLPEARTTDADFGVRTNQFGFNIRWASEKVVVVEASPNLSNPVWTPVSTNTLTGGSSYFSDPQWTNHPTRFYRVISPVP